MAWIKVKTLDEATGLLKQQYQAAQARGDRIWHVVSLMSQNPKVMKGSMDFYGALMFAPSPLSRGQREMLAVVVSAENHCVY